MSTMAENPDIDPNKAYQSTTLPEFKTRKQSLDEGAEKRVDEMCEYDAGVEDGTVSSRADGENGGSIIKDLKKNGESLKLSQEIHEEFVAMKEQEMDWSGDNHEERGKSCEEDDISIDLASKYNKNENEGRCEGDEPRVVMAQKLNRGGSCDDNEENGQDRVDTTTTGVLTKLLSQEIDRKLDESKESGAEGGNKIEEGSSEQEKQETDRVAIDTTTDRVLSLESKALKRGRDGNEGAQDSLFFASVDEEKGLIEVRKKSKIKEEDCRTEIPENNSSNTESKLEKAENLKPAVKVKGELKERIETVKNDTEQKTAIKGIENSDTDVKNRPSLKVFRGLFLFDPVKKIKMKSKYSLCWNHVKYYDVKQYPHLKGVVRCNLCQKDIVAANKGGGVNVRNHLISKHPEKYLELYPEGFMDKNTSKDSKSNVAARVRQKKRDKSATLNLHDGVGNGSGVNSPTAHNGAFIGGGASNVNGAEFFDISQSAAAAVAQAKAQAASIGPHPFWGVGWWNMAQAAARAHTAATAAGNAQPLAQHNAQQLAQQNSHHNSQNLARDHTQSTAEQHHIQLNEPMSRKTDTTKARSTARIRDEENNSSSDQKSKTQDEKWMELWDHTRLLLNQLRKEYKEETNGDVRGELERDIHKLKARKTQFENFLGMDT